MLVDLGGNGTFDMAIRSLNPVTSSDIAWTAPATNAVDTDTATTDVTSASAKGAGDPVVTAEDVRAAFLAHTTGQWHVGDVHAQIY